MRKLKVIISFLLVVTVMCAYSIPAQAVESKTVVLYQAEEIYNADDLMVRAKAGVDELSQNTGFEVTVSPSMVADLTVRSGETYVTSQLLKSELVDGKQIDTYVASVMNTIRLVNQ